MKVGQKEAFPSAEKQTEAQTEKEDGEDNVSSDITGTSKKGPRDALKLRPARPLFLGQPDPGS